MGQIILYIVGSLVFYTLSSNAKYQNVAIPLKANGYRLEYEIQDDKITFEAIVQTTGFVGFGMTNKSGMIESDIFIAGIYPDGEPYSGDYVSWETGVPTLDEKQDWELDNVTENEGVTTLIFSRLLNTNDWEHDIAIEDKVMSLIWAFGSNDEIVSESHHLQNRGIILFNLVSPNETSSTEPPTVDSAGESFKAFSMLLVLTSFLFLLK